MVSVLDVAGFQSLPDFLRSEGAWQTVVRGSTVKGLTALIASA
jgi:hypothetical protein